MSQNSGSEAVAGVFDPVLTGTITEEVLRTLAKRLGLSRASLMVVEGAQLRVVMGYQCPPDAIGQTVDAGSSPSWKAVEANQPVHILGAVSRDGSQFARPRASYLTPVRIAGRPIAVLNLSRNEDRAFSTSEQQGALSAVLELERSLERHSHLLAEVKAARAQGFSAVAALLSLLDKTQPLRAREARRAGLIALEIAERIRVPQILDTARDTTSLAACGGALIKGFPAGLTETLSLASISDTMLRVGVPFHVCHYLRFADEHWDGSGPLLQAENEIPLVSRVARIALEVARQTSGDVVTESSVRVLLGRSDLCPHVLRELERSLTEEKASPREG